MTKAQVDVHVNENGAAGEMTHADGFLTAGNRIFETWRVIGAELIEFSKAHVEASKLTDMSTRPIIDSLAVFRKTMLGGTASTDATR